MCGEPAESVRGRIRGNCRVQRRHLSLPDGVVRVDGLHQELRRRDAEKGAGLPGPAEWGRERLLRAARGVQGILTNVQIQQIYNGRR